MRLETARRMERVKRLLRERAEMALSEAVSRHRAEVERAAQCRRRSSEILGAFSEAAGDLDTGRLRADAEVSEGLQAIARKADARAKDLVRDVEAARAVLIEARKRERVAERLADRIHAREVDGALRREQAVLDEVGAWAPTQGEMGGEPIR
ncbi:MAG: flagellar FliJ family protein [Myxococcales bacterium]|nr:flagellar FliJ family protein [Myxococcales bacterium]